MSEHPTVKLQGRIFLQGSIKALTGLRIGGSAGPLAIGGVDLPVIRNGLDQRPYIPGSSLKGKMRSLAERMTGAPQNHNISQIRMHVAKSRDEYDAYWVNPLFGVPSEIGYAIDAPTRLTVRDVPLSDASAEDLDAARTELPYTEMKTEVAIDRITSAASPRQVERVPAGAIFAPMELVINIYTEQDLALFDNLLECLQLVEDDYIGGHGSRGSGKIAFQELQLSYRSTADYTTRQAFPEAPPKGWDNLADLVAQKAAANTFIRGLLNGGA